VSLEGKDVLISKRAEWDKKEREKIENEPLIMGNVQHESDVVKANMYILYSFIGYVYDRFKELNEISEIPESVVNSFIELYREVPKALEAITTVRVFTVDQLNSWRKLTDEMPYQADVFRGIIRKYIEAKPKINIPWDDYIKGADESVEFFTAMKFIKSDPVDREEETHYLRDSLMRMKNKIKMRASYIEWDIAEDIEDVIVPYASSITILLLENIIRNASGWAYGHQKEKAKVIVKAEKVKGDVVLTISDNGRAGTGNKDWSNYRLGASARKRFEGYGIGNYLAHRLVEILGGQINVRSKENVGTTVTVTLPRR